MNVGSSSSGISLLASNLFNKLDTTKKGYLEQSDMQTALSSLSSSSSTDSSDVFTQLDTDSDGKLTETELADGLQTLADALQTQLQQSRMQGMTDMPPPPPPPGGEMGTDTGFTQDELSSIASETTDTKQAELMNKLAANFEAADTDGNGKVTHDEAMAYDQSTRTDSTTASTSGVSSTDTTATTSDSLNLKLMAQLMQLLQAYGSSTSTTSSVSLAA